MRLIWLVGFCACTASGTQSKEDDPAASPPDATPDPTDDTGSRTDSGTPDDPPSDDSAEPQDSAAPPEDTAEEEEPSLVLLTGESIVCENPDARAVDGPMYRFESDGDWSNQRGEENLWSLYAGQGLAVEDFDGDGWLDVFLPNADADQLFMGTAEGGWRDESATRLPVAEDKAAGATPVDIDDDGDVDIFVAVMNDPNRVLLNDGTGHFSLSSAEWLQGQLRLSQSSSWGDIDGDGDLDVFVSNYTNWTSDWLHTAPSAPTEASNDALWLNQGDGSFVNADDRLAGFESANAFTFAAGFWDRDDDADLDLVVINDYRREYDWTQPVQYFENIGGSFLSTGLGLGLEFAVQGMGLAAAEMNGDGLLDFALQANNTLLMYSEAEYPYHEAGRSRGIFNHPDQEVGWGVELADMDNDGLTDLAAAYGFLPPDEVSMEIMPYPIVSDYIGGIRVEQPNSLYLQLLEGAFENVAPEWGLDDRGVSRGFVLADFNRDGFLDWMGRDLRGPTRLFLSRCDERSSLSIRLVQPPPNRDAVGAKVSVFSGDQVWTRWVHRGSTNVASGGPTALHFGLNDTEVVDAIEVRWPDGEVDRIEDVNARQRLVLERYGL